MRIARGAATVGVAGLMGLTGLGVAVAATDDTGGSASGGIVAALRGALDGLVDDGTITDEQADAVAGTLAESDALRHGGHHGPRGAGHLVDLDVAASTLGLTTDGLRTALSEDGATLAGVAEERGVATQTLVDALVAAATERLEAAVTDERLSRERADARIAALPDRVAEAVESELRARGGRGHHHGHGHGLGLGSGGPGGEAGDATPDAGTTGITGTGARTGGPVGGLDA